MLLFVFFLVVVLAMVGADEHAPDKAPVIDREKGWCENGTVTRTTGECICSSHMGFYCRESGDTKLCQSGYGISFFHHTCKECSCIHEKIPAGEWKERKNALKQSMRKHNSLLSRSAT